MKKALTYILCLLTAAVLLFTVTFHAIRNMPGDFAVIRLPLPGKTETTGSPQPGQLWVNINTATADELMALPGIGQVFAQRIIEYRDAHGPYSSVTDLLNIEGLGSGRLEAILDYITIGGQNEDTGR